MIDLAGSFARHGITRCAIMATTFRSGSRWMGRLMEDHGLSGMRGERLREVDRAADPAAALEEVVGAFPGPVFASRLMWPQRQRFARVLGLADDHAAFAAQFPDCRWMWLRRRDTIAHGISYWRAQRTGSWRKLASDDRPEPTAEYEFEGIDAAIGDVMAHSQGWATFFEATGIEPMTFWYEDLMAEPAAIGQYLAQFALPLVSTVSPLRVQADAYSDYCRDRYLDDCARRRSAAMPAAMSLP